MVWSIWRKRLIYLVMSAFVTFQSLVITITPAPDDHFGNWLRDLVQPYLTFFRLDNNWGFFAPNVGLGSLLRYDLEISATDRRTFIAGDELSWFHPNYFWFRFWFYRVMDDPENFAPMAAAYFCKKHADLHPVALTFFDIEEELYTHEDYLAGHPRRDPQFVSVTPLTRHECPPQ